MAAKFVLKKKEEFTFQLEGEKKVYSIPPVTKLPIEEIEEFRKIQDVESMTEQTEISKRFLLRHAPELENADLGAYEYMEIFGAYARSQKVDAGE